MPRSAALLRARPLAGLEIPRAPRQSTASSPAASLSSQRSPRILGQRQLTSFRESTELTIKNCADQPSVKAAQDEESWRKGCAAATPQEPTPLHCCVFAFDQILVVVTNSMIIRLFCSFPYSNNHTRPARLTPTHQGAQDLAASSCP